MVSRGDLNLSVSVLCLLLLLLMHAHRWLDVDERAQQVREGDGGWLLRGTAAPVVSSMMLLGETVVSLSPPPGEGEKAGASSRTPATTSQPTATATPSLPPTNQGVVFDPTQCVNPEVINGASVLRSHLERMVARQREMAVLTNDTHRPKLVMYGCPGGIDRGCGGWGDRAKAIINAFTLAFLLDRGFMMDVTRKYRLDELYSGEIDWSSFTENNMTQLEAQGKLTVFRVDCLNKYCGDCFVPTLVGQFNRLASVDVIWVRTNVDCADHLAKSSRFKDLARERGVFHHPNFYAAFYDFLMRPKPLLENAIRISLFPNMTLEDNRRQIPYACLFPPFAMHVRFGRFYTENGVQHGINGDEIQEAGQVEVRDLAQRYTSCAVQVLQHDGGGPGVQRKVFMAADNTVIFPYFVQGLGREWEVCDGSPSGEVRHIEYIDEKGAGAADLAMAVRTHVDFEVFRHVRFFLMGESGLSVFAFKCRAQYNQQIFSAYHPNNGPSNRPPVWCNRPFTAYTSHLP